MGKNKKSQIEYDGINFDSNEELEFYHWCIESKKHDIISYFKYNEDTFLLSPKQTIIEKKILKTKTKLVDKHLFHEHVYSPDFILLALKRVTETEIHNTLWLYQSWNFPHKYRHHVDRNWYVFITEIDTVN